MNQVLPLQNCVTHQKDIFQSRKNNVVLASVPPFQVQRPHISKLASHYLEIGITLPRKAPRARKLKSKLASGYILIKLHLTWTCNNGPVSLSGTCMQRSHSMRGTCIGFGRRLSAMRRGTARAARSSRPTIERPSPRAYPSPRPSLRALAWRRPLI